MCVGVINIPRTHFFHEATQRHEQLQGVGAHFNIMCVYKVNIQFFTVQPALVNRGHAG